MPYLHLVLSLMLLGGLAAGCVSGPGGGSHGLEPGDRQIDVWHGYSGKYKSKLTLGAADARHFASILAAGQKSPQAERAAIARAVSYFEFRTFDVTGILVDGRYFHNTAVIRDAGGVKWAVDSWYAPMGGAPDVLPLSDWMPRGFLSSGALN